MHPKLVLDETGLQIRSTPTASTTNIFNDHYKILLASYTGGPGDIPVNIKAVEKPITPFQLTDEGASLSYQFCSSFFKKSGTDQQYLLFSRDLIAAFGTLATGVLGATRGNQTATAIVGLKRSPTLRRERIQSKLPLFGG